MLFPHAGNTWEPREPGVGAIFFRRFAGHTDAHAHTGFSYLYFPRIYGFNRQNFLTEELLQKAFAHVCMCECVFVGRLAK